MARLNTVGDLIDTLRAWIEDLEENFDENQKLNVKPNTYGLSSPFIAFADGYVDPFNPCEEEMEWPEPDENLDEYGRDFEDVAEE